MQLDGLTYLIYTCNPQCLVPDKYGKLIFRATNHRKSEDNTKHALIDLPNNLSKPCTKCFEKSGLAKIILNKCNKTVSLKINLDYFHPKIYIPPWKYGDDNISPCETRMFTACS